MSTNFGIIAVLFLILSVYFSGLMSTIFFCIGVAVILLYVLLLVIEISLT